VAAEHRVALIEGTGQSLLPAIQFEDGSWYRDESQYMARTVLEGRLFEVSIHPPPQVIGDSR
jgi:hypothetical protein